MLQYCTRSTWLRIVLAIAMLFSLMPVTRAEATTSDCATINLQGYDLCVETLIHTNFGMTYYTVFLPTAMGDLPATLGVRDYGVMDLGKIQQRANLIWGWLPLPIPINPPSPPPLS